MHLIHKQLQKSGVGNAGFENNCNFRVKPSSPSFFHTKVLLQVIMTLLISQVMLQKHVATDNYNLQACTRIATKHSHTKLLTIDILRQTLLLHLHDTNA